MGSVWNVKQGEPRSLSVPDALATDDAHVGRRLRLGYPALVNVQELDAYLAYRLPRQHTMYIVKPSVTRPTGTPTAVPMVVASSDLV